MDNTIVVIFISTKHNIKVDLEIPNTITKRELLVGLNEGYDLKINISDIKKLFLKSENPISLLKGNKRLCDYGIRNGSVLFYTE